MYDLNNPGYFSYIIGVLPYLLILIVSTFQILIVDSVMALFRVDFTGRGELADRQQKLAQLLSR